MFRKTLTIISLIGLLLSVGLWAVSYFYLSYTIQTRSVHTQYAAAWGGLQYSSSAPPLRHGGQRFRLRVGSWWNLRGFRDFETGWVPSKRAGHLFIPLWIPSVLCSFVFAISYAPLRRRRKRKKLGLCVKCGYDLRASKDRCPECGNEFEIT